MSKHVKVNSPRHQARNYVSVLGGIGIVEILMILLSLVIIVVLFLLAISDIITTFLTLMLSFVVLATTLVLVRSNNKTMIKGWEYLILFPKGLFVKNKYTSKSWKRAFAKSRNNEDEEQNLNINKQYMLGYHIDGKNLNSLNLNDMKRELSNFNKVITNIDKKISIFKINEELDLDIVVNDLEKTKSTTENDFLKSALEENINTINSMDITNSRYIMIISFKKLENLEASEKKIDELLMHEVDFAQSKINNKDLEKIFKTITLTNDFEQEAKYEIKDEAIKLTIGKTKKYYSYLYVSSYEKMFNTGWLSRMFNSNEYMVNMTIDNIKDDLIIDEINKEIRNNDAYIAESNNDHEIGIKKKINRLLNEEITNIRNRVASINELGVLIRIEADTLRSIKHKFLKLRNDLNKDGLVLSMLKYNQLEAMRYVVPGCKSQIAFKVENEVTSTFISTSWPFMNDSLFDERGIIIGDIESRERLNLIDFRKSKNTRINSNMFVLASSGSGKTVLTSTIMDNKIKRGERLFVIDPENEYRNLALKYGGTVIDFSSEENKINVLQVIPSVDGEESIKEHVTFLGSFFKNLFPDIKPLQLSKIKGYIIKTYKDKKITEKKIAENYSSIKWPTFKDIQKTFETQRKDESAAIGEHIEIIDTYFQELTSGAYSKLWNCDTNLDIESNFVVFDISRYVDNSVVASSLMNIISRLVWQEMNRMYEENKTKSEDEVEYSNLIVDEAHLLMKKSNIESLEWLTQVTKRIRKRNGSVIIISQNVSDFLGDDEIKHLSSRIINNCTYSFIGQLKDSDLSDLSKLYEASGGLNEYEMNFISNARSFQFVLSVGQEKKVYLKNTRPNALNKKPLEWREQ